MPETTRTLTDGQRAYEARRAAKAGVSLDKWLADKRKQAEEAAREQAREAKISVKQTKKPGLIARLLDRAHKPL
jgi:hypothetical protein